MHMMKLRDIFLPSQKTQLQATTNTVVDSGFRQRLQDIGCPPLWRCSCEEDAGVEPPCRDPRLFITLSDMFSFDCLNVCFLCQEWPLLCWCCLLFEQFSLDCEACAHAALEPSKEQVLLCTIRSIGSDHRICERSALQAPNDGYSLRGTYLCLWR
jgi:hypothetical protein